MASQHGLRGNSINSAKGNEVEIEKIKVTHEINTGEDEMDGEGSLINYNLILTEDEGQIDVEVNVEITDDILTSASVNDSEEVTEAQITAPDDSAVKDKIFDKESKCIPSFPSPEEIVADGDDAIFGNVNGVPSRHVSQMQFCTREEAAEMANYVLSILEHDLFNYFNALEEDDSQSEDRLRLHMQSTLSIHSSYPDPLPGEPSTMELFYEYEPTNIQLRSTQTVETSDVGTEVNLHRKGSKPTMKDVSTITREMTFVDTLTAELVFRHNYPLKDDYKAPEIPSRKASLDQVITAAKEAQPNVEKAQVGPKIRWSKKTRLLPPLPQDYFKEETFWTGSVFRGKYVNRQLTHGRFEYPLMSVYESEFKNGHAHTDKHLGCVVYPRGDKFEGEWVKGRHVSGHITFADDLHFEQHNWSYLNKSDRRFFIEKDIGIKAAGETLFNDRFPPPYIPPGDYDTGYGIFNPDSGVVRGYSGEKLRDASYAECKWIMSACRKAKTLSERYLPTFHESRLPGSSVEKFFKQ